MLEHFRYLITGGLSMVHAWTFASVLGQYLTEEEKILYLNAIMECKRLEAMAISRVDPSLEFEVRKTPVDFRKIIEECKIIEDGKNGESGALIGDGKKGESIKLIEDDKSNRD